jgi:ArsR family transcriptional regulator, arsenate/arsenite/antimonite-responsive transcriptional repressor
MLRRREPSRLNDHQLNEMRAPNPTELTEEQVQMIAKALADSRRYEIIKRISQCKDSMACESVRQCLEISAPTLSHHMKELEIAGLIRAWRVGKCINYQLRREVLESFLQRIQRDFM